MAGQTQNTTKRIRRLVPALLENPVILKELRSRMRGNRAFIIVTLYLLLLGGFTGLVYLALLSTTRGGGGIEAGLVLGKTIFGSVVLIEMAMVCFIAPALTSGAIASEREHQTYELLRTTLLAPRALVTGKLFSAFSFLLLLLFVGMPLLAMAYVFGGVSVGEILIALLVLIVTAFAFSTVGLYISTIMKHTLSATVTSYTFTLLLVFGIPFLIYIALLMVSSLAFGSPTSAFNLAGSDFIQIFLIAIGWLFISINPISAAIASEAMLISEQNLFLIQAPLASGTQVPILAPWISLTIFYLLASLVLIRLSIRNVKRRER